MVSPHPLTTPGPVAQEVLGLAERLTTVGDEVLLIAPGRQEDRAGWQGRFVPSGGVRVPAKGRRARFTSMPQAAWRTQGALQAFRPDVVHVHEPFAPGPAMASVLAGVAPVLGTFHRTNAGAGYRSLGPVLRSLIPRIDRIVAVSQAAADTLARVTGYLPQPYLLGSVAGPATLEPAPDGWDDGHRRPVLCFVGGPDARSGLTILLEAVRMLGRPVEVRLVGDGPVPPGLQRMSAEVDDVRWLRGLDERGVAAEIARADLLVTPALVNQLSGDALLQAMAAGTAVVASDLPAHRMVAGEAATLVSPGDPTHLARAIVALLDDPARRMASIGAGRARVAASSYSSLAKAYRRHYAELAAGLGARRPQPRPANTFPRALP